ncbi:MAG TPA: hypothetical protein VM936_12765 [Pyrinomonadaceae bacterium]|nr:hypothetical protein [Pyrinomonadaceae bacterium]
MSAAVAAALLLLLALAPRGARTARAQDGGAKASDAAVSLVGAWQATMPAGLRVATLTIVQNGEGFGGAFVGYDYDSTAGAGKPKVSTRTGSMLTDARLEGDAFTFKVYIRHPSPPPGKPAGYEVSGEVKLLGGDAAELRLSAPHKPEPMVLRLTRE